MSLPIGDPRPAGDDGPAGDQRPAGDDGPAGDPRPAATEAEHSTADLVAETAEAYDPSAYTVAEVNEYLATVDDAERDRVLAAEAAGKGRSSIG